MRRISLVTMALLVLLVPISGNAEDAYFRRFDIGWVVVSYSRQFETDLYGGDLSFTTNINRRVGVVADVSVHAHSEADVQFTAYRFGPKMYGPKVGRLSSYGEILFGGTRISDPFPGGAHVDGVSLAAGGGLEVRVKPWFAWRALQADYSFMKISGSTSNGVRVGTGIVFRFGP